MECRHSGGRLIWEQTLTLPRVTQLVYRYAVVGPDMEVVKWDLDVHAVDLPCQLEPDAVVDLTDEWMVRLSGRLRNVLMRPWGMVTEWMHGLVMLPGRNVMPFYISMTIFAGHIASGTCSCTGRISRCHSPR